MKEKDYMFIRSSLYFLYLSISDLPLGILKMLILLCFRDVLQIVACQIASGLIYQPVCAVNVQYLH